ncbi:hypothetical protein PSTG_15416 [Puccinia striiformis f. sp. tritici PST-78]|uniref:CCZ1/INTU/HSP4 first Longin domain-containing protein n=1 Tax=Puccinia striiformis f. sp. tritici PST-78 TaxID=1165861 RepID=A0A0L0UW50_9BASI|nr:hypothetical protein PSTG_15416 [Puccinia striiformis f. sp. tritici PST-78]
MSSKITDTLNILSKPNQQQQEQQQQQQQSTSSSPYEPSETVLLNSLASAAQEYLLLHGSMSLLLAKNHLDELRGRLQKFWSVWLWRWNVSKTGCGAIDFHELLGGLQSPFLESPKIPRAPADLFSRFVTQICPTIGAQPILIHDRQVLHLPPPTDSIKLEEIQTLVRYLLSLLGGSEAKRQLTPTRPATNANLIVQQERNAIMKRLSGFDFSTLANLQPKLVSTTSSAIQPASEWAQKAFRWASASLVIPSNLFENNNIETDSLDQLLRADIGLPPPITSPPQLVRIKSSLSDPEIVKATPSSSRMASLRSTSSIGTNLLSSSASRSKLGYPHNLLMIYAPVKTTPFGVLLHYPDNLENLYGNKVVTQSPENESGQDCIPTVIQDPTIRSDLTAGGSTTTKDNVMREYKKPMTPSSTPGRLKDNPRSSDFNVEHALADAMSERSIGSLAALEFVRSKPFIEFIPTESDLSSGPTTSLHHDPIDEPTGPEQSKPLIPVLDHGFEPTRPSSTKTDSTTPVLKQIPIYVNNGRMTSSVYWIQIEGWTLAWVVGPSDEGDHHFPSSISSSCGASVIDGSSDRDGNETIVKHARAVLVALIESKWPGNSQISEQKTTEAGTAVGLQNITSPLQVSRQRIMIRDHSKGGTFFQQSGSKSSWLTRNEIWPGKIIPADEIEVSLGLLRLLDHRFVGKVAGPSSKPSTSGIMSQFEESFLRTKSGQWIVTKKIHHHSHIDQQQQQQVSKNEEDEHPQQHPLDRPHESGRFLDAFLVLPSGFGTLIEADNEMRILERQSELLEMSVV